MKAALVSELAELTALDAESLVEARYRKFRNMGVFAEPKR